MKQKTPSDWQIDLAIIAGQRRIIQKLIVDLNDKDLHLAQEEIYVKERFIKHGK